MSSSLQDDCVLGSRMMGMLSVLAAGADGGRWDGMAWPWRRSRGSAPSLRLFVASDIHGSDVCWRKFLNAGAFYKADVLVLAGDVTGKVLVPLVEQAGGAD